MKVHAYAITFFVFLPLYIASAIPHSRLARNITTHPRQRIRLQDEWRFSRSETIPDQITYDERPDIEDDENLYFMKPWILPSGNQFIANPDDRHELPSEDVPIIPEFTQDTYVDDEWETVQVPHDWAIVGPFYEGDDSPISGDMGRLPVQGVGWYRRTLDIVEEDRDKTIVLEIDGAMSYPMVWINGVLVGGWAYGYASFQVDLTPHVKSGPNQLAIRVENPSGDSSRWYPGAGLYRNVWLNKVNRVHVGQWGTNVTTMDVSPESATVQISVDVENNSQDDKQVVVATSIHEVSTTQVGGDVGKLVARIPDKHLLVRSGEVQTISGSVLIQDPKLWGPSPEQKPNRYVALTSLFDGDDDDEDTKTTTILDKYETTFGIRTITLDPNLGLFVNDQPIYIRGVNQHHDLGALGAAFNPRAARRQLETLRDLGVNAIRMAHNPPAPELLDMTDEMGFLVVDEIFDAWRAGKSTSDFHLIFDDWSEPDLRSFLRRDRHHPSVFLWSLGNEVLEQAQDDEAAASIASELNRIAKQEDPHRATTASIFRAEPDSLFAETLDVISLNYLGEGVRYGPAYAHLDGYRRDPQYDAFHSAQPGKFIFGSEVAWSLSSRGTYYPDLLPLTNFSTGSPVNDSSGGDSEKMEISAYELYTADGGASPDRVLAIQETHDFVAGGFVWAGWDYLGEPYPYSDDEKTARSSYSGIVDLAGFRKERFYLYQSHWRPDLPTAKIVPPHWSWPGEQVNKTTPVHVFSSGDEAELFVNGKSQGKKRLEKEPLTYRFRWDKVRFEPGEVRVVTYKDGLPWATDVVRTAGEAVGLRATSDVSVVVADGEDLAFVTVEVVDEEGRVVPDAENMIEFAVSGEDGVLVATDNGFQADLIAFPSPRRKAFHGLVLGIVKAKKGSQDGHMVVTVKSEGLRESTIELSIVQSPVE